MLKIAITFFALGLIAMLFGAMGFAGLSEDTGEVILSIFFIFALMSFIGSSEIDNKRHENISIK